MLKAADPGTFIGAFAVTDDHLGYFQVQLGGAKQQVEIAKGVEIVEIAAVFADQLIIGTEQHFRSSQSVFQTLPKQIGEEPAEELIARVVEETHGLLILKLATILVSW
jgi:hypothetical protein